MTAGALWSHQELIGFLEGEKKKHSAVVKAAHVTGREEAKLGTFSFLFLFLLEEQIRN